MIRLKWTDAGLIRFTIIGRICTKSSSESERESRRRFLKYGAAAVGGVVVGLAGGYGLSQSMAPPVTAPTTVTVTQTAGAATTAAAAGEPVTLVALLDQHATQGSRGIRTVQLAADEINQAGGVVINGQRRMFNVLSEDTKEEQASVVPSDVISAATKAIVDDHANALFGGNVSGPGLIPDVAAQYGCIYVTGAGGNMDHTKISSTNRYKYVFEDQIDVIGWGVVAAHISLAYAKKYNTKKVAWLSEDQLWCRKHNEIVESFLNENGVELDPITFFPPTHTGPFSTELQGIRNAGSPVTYTEFAMASSEPLFQEWRDTKTKTIFMSCDMNASNPDLGERAHGLYDTYIIVSGLGRVPMTSMTIPFYDAYQKALGVGPTMMDGNLYAAVYMYKGAIEKAQTLDPDIVADTIHNGTWLSPLGTLKFNDTNGIDVGNIDAGEGFILLYTQWQNRKLKVVWPERFAEAPPIFPDWDMPPSA